MSTYGALLEIYSYLGAACSQMIDEDDQIICNHVRAAKAKLEVLMKEVLKADREEALRAVSEAVEVERMAGRLHLVSDKAESKAYERAGLIAEYRQAKYHD